MYNQQNSLKQQILAKQRNNQSEFDNMWKQIKQTTNLSDKYKDGFVEALTAYTSNRAKAGGGIKENKGIAMAAVHEALPNLSPETYIQAQNIMTSTRNRFTEQQKQLLDMEREYNQLVTNFPNILVFKFLHIKEIHTTIVTSTKTEESFNTGKDDDI